MSVASLRKTLRNLPKTLDSTYERILASIDPEYHNEACRALLWLAFARRTLTLEEVAEDAVFDPDTVFDCEQRFPDPNYILEVLGSLVTVSPRKTARIELFDVRSLVDHPDSDDESDVDSGVDSDFGSEIAFDATVTLAHFSVKEYLVSDRIQKEAAVELLMERDGAIDEPNNRGQSALHAAAYMRHSAIIRQLLERGANIEAKDDNGSTSLHHAVEMENEPTVQILLDHRADTEGKNLDIDAQNEEGRTALHEVALSGPEAFIEMLLNHGANINTMDNEKETAVDIANSYRNGRAKDLLLTHLAAHTSLPPPLLTAEGVKVDPLETIQ
ncbi:MAG: hypothetical protein MMC33_002879 [Icmadophila ericetorum]|nr:hypothetical protein [Icmadophila ericetorum]